jgi:hypothetical protein
MWLVVVLVSPLTSWAFEGTLVAPRVGAITGLQWTSSRVEIQIRGVDSRDRVIAVLKGNFKNPGWTLIISNRTIHPDTSGDFQIGLPAHDLKNNFTIYSVSDFGKAEKSVVQISIAPSDMALITSKARWISSVGLGLTSQTYTQSLSDPVKQTLITGKFSFAHEISRNQRWFGTFSARVDLVPISDSIGTSGGSSGLRFLGLNARVDYSVPFVTDPWKLNFAMGYYYVTTIGNSFLGFTDVAGPQAFPSVRYYFRNENYLSAYAKYSPVLSSGKPLPFSNRDIEVGADYGFPLKDSHSMSISLDYSSLNLLLDDGTQSSLRSLMLALSYTL